MVCCKKGVGCVCRSVCTRVVNGKEGEGVSVRGGSVL